MFIHRFQTVKGYVYQCSNVLKCHKLPEKVTINNKNNNQLFLFSCFTLSTSLYPTFLPLPLTLPFSTISFPLILPLSIPLFYTPPDCVSPFLPSFLLLAPPPCHLLDH